MDNVEKIKYFVIDVDGTMTDTGLYYDDYGNELKRFSTKDGAGIIAAKAMGIKIIVLTGRKCEATKKRMEELHIDRFEQGVINKKERLESIMEEQGIISEELGYIGDDLNDLKAMELVGFIGCPMDSCREVLKKADYISSLKGGYGAVRDVLEYVLRARKEWDAAIIKAF